MICTPEGPCGTATAALVTPAPAPGRETLERRLGSFDGFVSDLIARVEQRQLPGSAGPLGTRWDVEGDPNAMDLVRLWAFVAEGVAAYTELTAGEAYLATARDWVDLARLAEQIGYRPTQRVAAEGWIRFDTDRAASPTVPSGTRVQASGKPDRAAQTYEVVTDTPLFADWANLTATWVPQPASPAGRTVRFLGDPGFRAGDSVLFIAETPPAPSPADWLEFWLWLLGLISTPTPSTVTPIAVVGVVGEERQLGTTLIEFDRELGELLGDQSTSYVAYRILDTASTARRLSKVLRVNASDALEPLNVTGYTQSVTSDTSVVLDRALDNLSTGRLVAIVDWNTTGNQGDVVAIADHTPIDWELVPGTPVRVSQLHFASAVGTLGAGAGTRSIYVLDRRVIATHYEFPVTKPAQSPGAGLQLRVFPAPATPAPPAGKLAVETDTGGVMSWELVDVTAASSTEVADPASDTQVGLILDVVANAPTGDVVFARATGNVARVRHGVTVSSVLGSGDGITTNQTLDVPESPVAAEIDVTGTPASSLLLRVDGRRWLESPTLFGAGPVEAFETRLGPEGEVEVRFGDGGDGAIPGSGVNNITATYRVGGGTVGEVGANEIDTLLGSLRGVRSIIGAGPTAGGADQPVEHQLRREAPTRARSMDRVIALADLADLALAFPGVSHATSWLGAGPAGTACPPGAHVAVLRYGATGVRAALGAELQALAAYLDARRDVTIPLCVVSAAVVAVDLLLTVTGDPALESTAVQAAVVAALTDPDSVLAAERRSLGQPLDRSDVLVLVHGVAGVVGVDSLTMTTATASASTAALGRLAADRYELLLPSPPTVTVVQS
jgi:hypothetical protein